MCIFFSASTPFYYQFSVVRHEVLVLNLASTPYLALYPPDFRFTLSLSSVSFPLMCPPYITPCSLSPAQDTNIIYLKYVLFDPSGLKYVASNTGRHHPRARRDGVIGSGNVHWPRISETRFNIYSGHYIGKRACMREIEGEKKLV